jgi:hypothetical protein
VQEVLLGPKKQEGGLDKQRTATKEEREKQRACDGKEKFFGLKFEEKLR